VAAWVFKTTLVFHQVVPQQALIPREHYAHLYQTRHRPTPPPRTHIWLAHYLGEKHRFGDWRSEELRAPEPYRTQLAGYRGYVVTFCVGKLIAHVYSSFGYDERFDFAPTDTGTFDRALVAVWPIRGSAINWAPGITQPEVGLDDRGFSELTRSFARGDVPAFPENLPNTALRPPATGRHETPLA
jgi:hypothetical protein